LLCAHGATLETLGLAFAAYSLAAILAEVPSGIFADLHGRKNSFLLSCALQAAGGLGLLLSGSFAAVFIAMLLQGLGRAFSSGSVDALVMEESIARGGEAEIGKTVSLLSVFQCAGISLGALVGGFLPQAGGYFRHIVLRTALVGAVGILTAFTVREAPARSGRRGLRTQLAQVGSLLREKRNLRYLLFCAVVIMVMQAMIETYWQPQFLSLAGEHAQRWLGVLSAGAFLATVCGSLLMGRALKTERENACWTAYLALSASMAALVLLLARQESPAGFSASYLGLYLAIGLLAVPEQSILNLEAENAVRASLLSVLSFAAQAGGLIGALLAAGLLLRGEISLAWTVGALLAAGGTASVFFRRRRTLRVPVPESGKQI
ncbi:MAG TPA: MFS transporter, partial [Oscillospiraceae bacterium]|nr:MFS transporter [Oscillospiraceae bacterium]